LKVIIREGYAGGSVSIWLGHPSQTGQKVAARLTVVHWSSRLGVGHGANNSTPVKSFLYETSKKKRRRTSFFKNCKPRRKRKT